MATEQIRYLQKRLDAAFSAHKWETPKLKKTPQVLSAERAIRAYSRITERHDKKARQLEADYKKRIIADRDDVREKILFSENGTALAALKKFEAKYGKGN